MSLPPLTNFDRAAAIIHEHRKDIYLGPEPRPAAQELEAKGLLVTEEKERLIRLGEAVEKFMPVWSSHLDAIYSPP